MLAMAGIFRPVGGICGRCVPRWLTEMAKRPDREPSQNLKRREEGNEPMCGDLEFTAGRYWTRDSRRRPTSRQSERPKLARAGQRSSHSHQRKQKEMRPLE
jgi:hypothetical protein